MIKYNTNEIYLITITLAVIFSGIFGNILNIFVFVQKNLFKIPTFRMLFYLSLIDLLVILVCANDLLFTFSFKIQIKLYSTLSCRLHTYLTSYLTQTSSILLAMVSIERAFVINNKHAKCFRLKHIEKLILTIIVLLAVLNLHYLFYFNLGLNKNLQVKLNLTEIFNTDVNKQLLKSKENLTHFLSEIKSFNEKSFHQIEITQLQLQLKTHDYLSIQEPDTSFFICYPFNHPTYDYFFHRIWTWIHSWLYSFMPIIVMITCSIIILMELQKKNKRFLRVSANFNRNLLQNRLKRKHQVLFMLISTNIFFIICSIPYCISHYETSFAHVETERTHSTYIIHALSYSNNSINFIFYLIFSSKYRDECSKLIAKFKLINIDLDAELVINNNQNEQNTYSNRGRTNRLRYSNQLHSMRQFSREPRGDIKSSFLSSYSKKSNCLNLDYSNDHFKILRMIDEETC